MNLRHTTRDIVRQVGQRAGYPVEVAQGRALPAPAGVHRASRQCLSAVQAHFCAREINAAGLARVGQRGLRPGVVWCMAGPLEACEVRPVGFKGALPDLNKAEPKRTLSTLPGEYSALHVVAVTVAASR